jgi:trans-aconitate 2-methyltransferase
MTTWDEAQYRKFIDARTRPAAELLARVPLTAAERVIDLGSGPGNSTALLAARWPDAHITGIDNSPEMLQSARAALPHLEWIEADVAQYRPASPVDVCFSNATLQWLPDHAQLFPQLLACVREGGVLAIQMPFNFAEPSHRLMREISRKFLAEGQVVRAIATLQEPGLYYDLLAPQSRGVDIWQTRYEQVVPDSAAIVEWVKGTGLRPYLEALPSAARAPFLDEYTRAIDAAYPVRSDGRRLFSFPRLFIVAVR